MRLKPDKVRLRSGRPGNRSRWRCTCLKRSCAMNSLELADGARLPPDGESPWALFSGPLEFKGYDYVPGKAKASGVRVWETDSPSDASSVLLPHGLVSQLCSFQATQLDELRGLRSLHERRLHHLQKHGCLKDTWRPIGSVRVLLSHSCLCSSIHDIQSPSCQVNAASSSSLEDSSECCASTPLLEII